MLSALANHQSIDRLIVKPTKKRQTTKKASQAELNSLHQQLKGLIANYQALLSRAEEVGLMPLEKQRRWLDKAQRILENHRATKAVLSKEVAYLEDQIDRWSDQINRRQLD